MTTEQVASLLLSEQRNISGKGKAKALPITILTFGGSMMGGLAVSEWWFRGLLELGSLWVTEKKKSRKGYRLERLAASRAAIVLLGHDRQFSEGDVAKQVMLRHREQNPTTGVSFFSCVMDGTSRLASIDGKQAMLDYMTANVVATTFTNVPAFYVDVTAGDDSGARTKEECSNEIVAALAKSTRLPEIALWELDRPASTPPARVQLLTEKMIGELRANTTGRPLYKLFGGACTWLCVSMDADDSDTIWGWADLGLGIVEFGTFSLREIETIRFKPLGLPAERDRHFDGKRIDTDTLGSRTTLAGI